MIEVVQNHGDQKYIYRLFDTETESVVEAMNDCCDKAKNPALNFDRLDAADIALNLGKLVTKENLKKK